MSRHNLGWMRWLGKNEARKQPWKRDDKARGKWTKLLVEQLEQRLAPVANLTYDWSSDHSLLSGANLTLRVADHDGASWLQIFDSDSAIVAMEEQLDEQIDVAITGGPVFSDVLKIDFSYSGAAASRVITVTFDGGGPDLFGIDDNVQFIGSGTVYQPSDFTLTSKDNVIISGKLSTTNDLTIQAITEDSEGLPVLGDLVFTANSEITMDGDGDLTAGNDITLRAQSTITITDSAFGLSSVRIAFAVGTSDASVAISGGIINATNDLTIEAISNVTATLTTVPDDAEDDNEDVDAAVAKS